MTVDQWPEMTAVNETDQPPCMCRGERIRKSRVCQRGTHAMGEGIAGGSKWGVPAVALLPVAPGGQGRWVPHRR